MTTADDHLAVADAIEQLPPDLREELAKGPLEDPLCRICRTLRPGCETDAIGTLLAFHDLGNDELAEAAHDALGKDRRLSRVERETGDGYRRKLERLPERNVQRVTVVSLAQNAMWWRCLYVYLLAGWRP